MSEARIAGAAPPQPSRCVHCGQPLTEETKDHISEIVVSVYDPAGSPAVDSPQLQEVQWRPWQGRERVVHPTCALSRPQYGRSVRPSAKAVRSMGIGAEGISLKESSIAGY